MYRNTYKYVNKEKKGKNTHLPFYNAIPLWLSNNLPNRSPKYTRTFNPHIEKKIQKEEKILRVVLFHLFLAASDFLFLFFIYIKLGSANFLLMPIPCINHPQLLSFCSFLRAVTKHNLTARKPNMNLKRIEIAQDHMLTFKHAFNGKK